MLEEWHPDYYSHTCTDDISLFFSDWDYSQRTYIAPKLRIPPTAILVL